MTIAPRDMIVSRTALPKAAPSSGSVAELFFYLKLDCGQSDYSKISLNLSTSPKSWKGAARMTEDLLGRQKSYRKKEWPGGPSPGKGNPSRAQMPAKPRVFWSTVFFRPYSVPVSRRVRAGGAKSISFRIICLRAWTSPVKVGCVF
jgi:hypothetical protein